MQLPFVVPPPGPEDLNGYVASLMSVDEVKSESRPDAFDKAAQAVQKSASPLTPDQVVQQVAAKQPLATHEQESLKKDVKIIQHMDENIKRFSDQEQSMCELISHYAKEYFNNPRDMKRFVHVFRFYYFLRAARLARGEKVASVEQMCRWLALSQTCSIYNADGERVRKTYSTQGTCAQPTSSTTNDYVLDVASHIIRIAGIRNEVYIGNRHLVTDVFNSTSFIHTDWLGTDRARSSVTGSSYDTVTVADFRL